VTRAVNHSPGFPESSPNTRKGWQHMTVRRGLLWLIAGLLCVPALAQPDGDAAGPRLKVPAPDAHLFFAPQPVVVEGSLFVPLASIERWWSSKIEGDRRGEFSIVYQTEEASSVLVTLWVGQPRARVAQAEVPLETPPQVIGEETFVPLLFLAEAVGVWVEPYDHTIRLRKPDDQWVCHLAIPPHPLSLEGKMLALALARRPELPKRVEVIRLSGDTMSGFASLAEPADNEAGFRRYTAHYKRDRAGWHFVAEGAPVAPPDPPGDE